MITGILTLINILFQEFMLKATERSNIRYKFLYICKVHIICCLCPYHFDLFDPTSGVVLSSVPLS